MTSRDVDPIERMKARFWLILNHYEGYAVALGFCIAAGVLWIALVSQISPVAKTEQVSGIVEYVATGPAHPEATVGRGFYYVYTIRLDDGWRVQVQGDVNRPLLLGQYVSINRQRRENSRVTYHLPGPAGYGL